MEVSSEKKHSICIKQIICRTILQYARIFICKSLAYCKSIPPFCTGWQAALRRGSSCRSLTPRGAAVYREAPLQKPNAAGYGFCPRRAPGLYCGGVSSQRKRVSLISSQTRRALKSNLRRHPRHHMPQRRQQDGRLWFQIPGEIHRHGKFFFDMDQENSLSISNPSVHSLFQLYDTHTAFHNFLHRFPVHFLLTRERRHDIINLHK